MTAPSQSGSGTGLTHQSAKGSPWSVPPSGTTPLTLSPGTCSANARTTTDFSGVSLGSTTCRSTVATVLRRPACQLPAAPCPPTSPPLMQQHTMQPSPTAWPHSLSTKPPPGRITASALPSSRSGSGVLLAYALPPPIALPRIGPPGATPCPSSMPVPRPADRLLGAFRGDSALPSTAAAVLAQAHLRALGCDTPDWAAVCAGTAAAPPPPSALENQKPPAILGLSRVGSASLPAPAMSAPMRRTLLTSHPRLERCCCRRPGPSPPEP